MLKRRALLGNSFAKRIATILLLACAAWAFGTMTSYAAPLTFSTTMISLTSPAVNLTIASGSTADTFTVNATSVVVSLSATGGNSLTLTSAQRDLSVSASAGGGTDPITCLNSGLTGVSGVDEVVLTQQSGSAAYTIVPAGTTRCMTINNSAGGITVYPIVIHAPSYASTTLGNTLVIPVSTTDPNGYPVSLSAALPPDATFSTSTGDLTWRPQSAGTASATIVASDKATRTTSTIELEAFAPTSGEGAASASGASGLSGTGSSTAPSIAALKAEIAALEKQVQHLLAELKSRGATVGGSMSYAFTRDLTVGSRGDDVHALQVFLVQQDSGPAARTLKANGTTRYFGSLTRAALAEYQASVGIKPAAGYFGPITREYLRAHS